MAYQLPIQKPAPQQIPVASALPALDVSNSAPAQPEEDLGQLGFSAFVDSQIGAAGFKASTSDGKSGFIIQSGPYKGKSKEQAMEALRAQYVAFPPDQKQRWEARGTGRDLNSQPPGAGKPMQGQGKAPMNYSMSGSAPSFSGLDWLRANRKTGDELAQAESNVAWTGDRNRTPRINPLALGKKYDEGLKANFDRSNAQNGDSALAPPTPAPLPISKPVPSAAQPTIPQSSQAQPAPVAAPPAQQLPISKPVGPPPINLPTPATAEGKLAEVRRQNMANMPQQPPELTPQESADLEELRRKAKAAQPGGMALR